MQKQLSVEGIDSPVIYARRKGTRSIRLSIKSDGVVRLSIPYGVTERFATKFLLSKADWVNSHSTTPTYLRESSRIGKSHTMHFTQATTQAARTSIIRGQIIVPVKPGQSISDAYVQSKARKAAERALKKEAEALLPQRLATLASKHNIQYKSVITKKLRSRWGSCDNHKSITLNIYLMQLDWRLIDYVLLHELTHTYHQHHQPNFWKYLETICPSAKALRKELKTYPTSVFATKL